ncbi:MAG: septum formation initiator family protein [Kiritimatiellae bacterium]|nr:septum formation initiator family protein [Kiritimatiellia bacterium]
MKEDFRKTLMLWFTVIAVVSVIGVGVFTLVPQCERRSFFRKKEAELRAQIEAKKREIAKLSENQRRFREDSDFVESIARQNRRVFPGELVFIFED